MTMRATPMNWSALGAAALALAVVAGAFGAHALRGRLDSSLLGVYEKAVYYQFIHALALLTMPLFARLNLLSRAATQWVCALLLAGIILFCGSLYILALGRVPFIGVVTPFGGLAFIAAWVLLGFGLLRNSRA